MEGYDTSEPVLVLLRAANYEVAVAIDNHASGKWYGNYFGDYGDCVPPLVTNWKFVGALPNPLPVAFIKELEPDFGFNETPMRALFAGVDAADNSLHKILYAAVRDNETQGVWIRPAPNNEPSTRWTFWLVTRWNYGIQSRSSANWM